MPLLDAKTIEFFLSGQSLMGKRDIRKKKKQKKKIQNNYNDDSHI